LKLEFGSATTGYLIHAVYGKRSAKYLPKVGF